MRKKSRESRFITLKDPPITLLFWLLASTILLMFTRILLYFFNPGYFPDISIQSLLRYSFLGLRFDIPAVLYANSAVILLLLLPFRSRHHRRYIQFSRILYLFSSTVMLIPNLADIIYYRFNMKRMTGDIFGFMKVAMESNLAFRFLQDYWYIFLIGIGCLLILIWFSKKVSISPTLPLGSGRRYYISQIILTLLFSGLVLLGMRGGIQLKPVSIITASEYADPQNVPIVLNSAFTIMKTLDQKGLEQKNDFNSDPELAGIFNPEHRYLNTDSTGAVLPFNRLNVVIIILESFSREHFGIYNRQAEGGNYKGFTPFLDSLATHCYSFNGFANGKRSIEGIPAILGGMPTWMDQDFITSIYASNTTQSLASLLKTYGYTSAFFHGGNNGTMGFDHYARSAGFDQYFGRKEYNQDEDYDGEWGIWDEPFLQFFAEKLNSMPQPFLASVFTLSSHHPFEVPEKYKGKFRKGILPIQETIMYTDYSLKEFFQRAAKNTWYNQTLFVITADHTSEASMADYKTRVGQYRIPILFFHPGKLAVYTQEPLMQQTDIMPSILDYLNYPSPFVAFGSSVFTASEPRFSLSLFNGSYQLIQDDFVLGSDQQSGASLYNYKLDPLLQMDMTIKEQERFHSMNRLLKAVIQQYNNRMIENRLTIK